MSRITVEKAPDNSTYLDTFVRPKGKLYLWECENGHKFKASLEYVLSGGGWCPECGYDNVYTSTTRKNKFISAVLSPQYLG